MTDRLSSTDIAAEKPVRRRPRRTAGQNRAEILRAATAEFATHGFAGGRITRIVKKAGTNPRMITSCSAASWSFMWRRWKAR